MLNQAWKEEYFIRALEEEAIEVESLLVEPQTHNASVDGVFLYPKENPECIEIVHLPRELGGQHKNAAGNREDKSEPKVPNELPDEVREENIQAANGLSIACDDYLLDIGLAESFAYFDDAFNDGLHSAYSGLASQDPGFSCKDEPKTLDEAKPLKCTTLCESPNVDKSTQSLQGHSSDKNEKDTIFPQDFTSDGMSCSSRSVENNETTVCKSDEIESRHEWETSNMTSAREGNVVTFLNQKRSRKPTQRYIDEWPNYASRQCRKRPEISHSATKKKILGVQCPKRRRSMGSKEKKLPADELFGEAIQVPFDSQAIQVPLNSQAPTECLKAQTAIQTQMRNSSEELSQADSEDEPEARARSHGGSAQRKLHKMRNSCEELSPAGSEDEAEARTKSHGGSAQRKLHKVWSISEVRKLIDGVSSCGVGRWTEIKKLLFSSSDHRTPVDLKDKWRNLLKAARCPVKQSKKEDERKRNQPWRPLPKSVLCRVRELAMVHPYPREAKSKISKSKLSNIHHLSSSTDLPARTKVFRFNEIVVHEKICT